MGWVRSALGNKQQQVLPCLGVHVLLFLGGESRRDTHALTLRLSDTDATDLCRGCALHDALVGLRRLHHL